MVASFNSKRNKEATLEPELQAIFIKTLKK